MACSSPRSMIRRKELGGLAFLHMQNVRRPHDEWRVAFREARAHLPPELSETYCQCGSGLAFLARMVLSEGSGVRNRSGNQNRSFDAIGILVSMAEKVIVCFLEVLL